MYELHSLNHFGGWPSHVRTLEGEKRRLQGCMVIEGEQEQITLSGQFMM